MQAGPNANGFELHIYASDEGKIIVNFGVPLKSLPMPAESARELAVQVYEKWKQIGSQNGVLATSPVVRVSVMERKVVLECTAEVDHLAFMPAEAKLFCLELMEAFAKITGRRPV